MNKNLAFEPPFRHMLAKAALQLPQGEKWLYEPKWDGFRALVFFDGEEIRLQSRDLKPLNRYFPELEAELKLVLPSPAILDGEIVIATGTGLDFDALQMRIHPTDSRVQLLAKEAPASFVAFDLLALGQEDLRSEPFAKRRQLLVETLSTVKPPVYLTPATNDRTLAADWFERFEGAGLDGVVAKINEERYKPGQRSWLKIKHKRSLDCVVGGFRWNRGDEGSSVGSLLLGLFDSSGVLHHVGHTSSFKAKEKRDLATKLAEFVSDDSTEGFGRGRTPGEPSRWTGGRDMSWVRLRPNLVCEVSFDQLQGDRLRHASTFQRWRLDKSPSECTYDQIAIVPPFELAQIFQPA